VTAKTIKVVKNCQLQTQPVVILFRRQIWVFLRMIFKLPRYYVILDP
jgi:hypothetical protein